MWLFVTGDIADHGEPEEYKQARAELAAEVPVLVLPGNHDDRSNFRKVLLDQEGNAPINQTRMIGGALYALCDSSIPGRDDGMLTQETLEWLDALVTRTAAHVFIAIHHPPVALHNPLIDEIRLTEANQLTQLIERHPQVVAVLCGHAQTAAVWPWPGDRCSSHPASSRPFGCPGPPLVS